MRKGTKILLLIINFLALLGLVLLGMMAWPMSGYDLTLVPRLNVWFYLAMISALLILIVLIYILVHVLRQPTRGVDLLDKKDGGTVRVSADSLRSIAERTAKLRPEVAAATAEVYQNKKDTAIDLMMNLKVKGDQVGNLSVRTIAEDIKQDVSREIQNFSGYPLGDFHLNVAIDDAEKLPVRALADEAEVYQAPPIAPAKPVSAPVSDPPPEAPVVPPLPQTAETPQVADPEPDLSAVVFEEEPTSILAEPPSVETVDFKAKTADERALFEAPAAELQETLRGSEGDYAALEEAGTASPEVMAAELGQVGYEASGMPKFKEEETMNPGQLSNPSS